MHIEQSGLDTNLSSGAVVSTRVTSRKKGIAAYAKNPFWRPTEVKVGTRKVTIAGGFIARNDSGEGVHHAGIHRVEHVDESRFIKLFTDNLKVFFDLSTPSQKVLHCVLAELQKHPDAEGLWLPWFTVEDFAIEKSIKISRASFQRALKEMLEKGFIAESENQNFYWINPNLFFNGDRMVFISEYRKTPKVQTKSIKSATQ